MFPLLCGSPSSCSGPCHPGDVVLGTQGHVPEKSRPQGQLAVGECGRKQLEEQGLNPAVGGRAEPGMGQPCPHAFPAPFPGPQRSSFPGYSGLGIHSALPFPLAPTLWVESRPSVLPVTPQCPA